VRNTFKVIIAVAVVAGAAIPAEAAGGTHCATMLVPLEPIGGVTQAAVEPIGCFATYDQALEAGTGTTLDVSADLTPTTLTAEAAAEISTASSVLIGTEYNLFNFLGDSNSYFAASTCSAGVVWEVSNVGATWNDKFQSGKGFGGCDTNKKFEHQNFGGAVKTCTPNCGDYGSLANKVTSLRWRP
jgi:hypothetical protein